MGIGARGEGNCGERRGEGRGKETRPGPRAGARLLQSGRGRGLLCSRRDGCGLPLVVDDGVAGVYGGIGDRG